MPAFVYKAIQASGAVAEGRIEVAGRQEAFRQLEQRGLKPISLTEAANGAEPGRIASLASRRRKRVPHRALENFTRQLSSLLAAGVPLSRALTILCKETSTPAAAEEWKRVHDMVVDGTALAEAMAQSPQTFPRVYTAMVHAGETGGFLDIVLGQIAEFQSREKEIRGRVMSALIYPCVLLVLAVGVLIFLLTFFIPRFQKLFSDFGGTLPLLTRAIIKVSDILTSYGPLVAVALVIGFLMVRSWLRSEQGRRSWEQFILRLPIIGSLTSRFAMSRFTRMLGTLIGSGVPLISALRVARESLGNQLLIDAVGQSIDRVKQGEGLAASLLDCKGLFPESVLEMVAVAEETGKLDSELVRVAAVTEVDLDRQLKTAVSLAEPLLLFMMAAFIGTIFVGMVIPIFTIQEYIK
jgi:type II secretory pathway component PulF